MKGAAVVGVLFLTACTSASSPIAQISPKPSPSLGPSVSTVAASPSVDSTRPSPATSPVASASLPAINLSCRLPVTWGVLNAQTITAKAGFITFPSQTLQEDPSAPVGKSVFYDRAFSTWLPVWRANVSPDGRRYAYSEGNAYQNTGGKLHVVDVATGTDRVIYSGSTVFSVVDFAPEGIYLTAAAPEGRPHGIWLESVAGGPPRVIDDTVAAPAVGAGQAWGLEFNAADKSPAPGGLEGPMNQVVNVDLHTGAATTWFYRPGADIYVAGVDADGLPMVSAGFAPSPTDTNGRETAELWLITSPTSATRLFLGTGVPYPSRLAAVDSHGAWFDGSYGNEGGSVWLYAGGSFQAVATVGVSYLAVAGGCIP